MTKILVENVKNRENIIWAKKKKKKDKKTIIYHSYQKMTTFLVMAFSSFILQFRDYGAVTPENF